MIERCMIEDFGTKILGDFNRVICTTAIYYAYTIYYSVERLNTSFYIYFLILGEDDGCNVCHFY